MIGIESLADMEWYSVSFEYDDGAVTDPVTFALTVPLTEFEWKVQRSGTIVSMVVLLGGKFLSRLPMSGGEPVHVSKGSDVSVSIPVKPRR
jgi:hypothetical protein